MALCLQPIDFDNACLVIARLHRHHLPPVGWKFGIAAAEDAVVVGVITCGRPVARAYDNGWTIEVTRCCTDGTKNAGSFLYGAAWRAAKALGYRRLITYTLPSESGSSLRAAGYRTVHETRGQTWNRPSRARVDKHPTSPKLLWEASA